MLKANPFSRLSVILIERDKGVADSQLEELGNLNPIVNYLGSLAGSPSPFHGRRRSVAEHSS
jgi:hypothetical protein